jgi:hypothetical protein
VPRLDIVLTDGFSGDHVVVSVDGSPVFDGVVSTDQRVGVARAVRPAPHRTGPVSVEVGMAERGLAASAVVAEDDGRVEIALLDGELRLDAMGERGAGHA